MKQSITPELRTWIIEQARSGVTAEAALQAMQASGWQEDVALHALETVLREHLQNTPQNEPMPQRLRVPELALEDAPLHLDLEDRRVQILAAIEHPRIVVIGDFLSGQECEALIEGAKPRMARSLTVAARDTGQEVNEDRTSSGMFYTRAENEWVARVERRIAQLTRWPIENGEGLQVLNYGPGAQYKPHYDYFDPDEPGTPTLTQHGGQRVATLIMYLNNPSKGGGTVFPHLQLQIAPQRGNAVFFSYDRPHPSTASLHGGAPVIEGEKWIATKWLREGKFV